MCNSVLGLLYNTFCNTMIGVCYVISSVMVTVYRCSSKYLNLEQKEVWRVLIDIEMHYVWWCGKLIVCAIFMIFLLMWLSVNLCRSWWLFMFGCLNLEKTLWPYLALRKTTLCLSLFQLIFHWIKCSESSRFEVVMSSSSSNNWNISSCLKKPWNKHAH